MRLDIYHHPAVEIAQKLDAILHKLTRMENSMATAAETLDAITASLQSQSTVEDSVLALLTSIKNQLAEALKGETLSAAAQAKLAAIMPLLEANTAKLSAAIVDNTPAAPPTTPPVAAPDPSPAGASVAPGSSAPTTSGTVTP